MITRVLTWLFAKCGYVLYTLAALALVLWLLFPQEKVQRLVVQGLNASFPRLVWQVQAFDVGLTDGVELRSIDGFEPGNTTKPLVRIDFLRFTPDLRESLKQKKIAGRYEVHAGKGTVAGTLHYQHDTKALAVTGAIQGLQLSEIELLGRQLQRNVQGTVSGTFEASAQVADRQFTALEAQLKAENGRVDLKQPVLGNAFIPYQQATVAIHVKDGKVLLDQGSVESKLLTGSYAGEIRLRPDLVASTVSLKGSINPRPEFFKGIGNAAVIQNIRQQMKGKPLTFQMSGTLQSPSIYFDEYAMLFETLSKERK